MGQGRCAAITHSIQMVGLDRRVVLLGRDFLISRCLPLVVGFIILMLNLMLLLLVVMRLLVSATSWIVIILLSGCKLLNIR